MIHLTSQTGTCIQPWEKQMRYLRRVPNHHHCAGITWPYGTAARIAKPTVQTVTLLSRPNSLLHPDALFTRIQTNTLTIKQNAIKAIFHPDILTLYRAFP